MWNVRGSHIIACFSALLLSGCSLAPNGPTNRIRISLPGGSSQSNNLRKNSHLFAGVRGLEVIQQVLGIHSLEADPLLPFDLPTAAPSSVPSSPTGFQCFGINVTGPGIRQPLGLPKDTCVPSNMPGSGIYGGLVYSAVGGDVEVEVPSGPDRTIQVFGIQTGGYCPNLAEITSQPLGMNPFQYAYELGRSKVDIMDDASVTVKISSNSSSAPRMFCDTAAASPTHQWTNHIGASLAVVGVTGIALDSSSNVYLAGTTTKTLTQNLQYGVHDAFVTKYDSSGNLTWTRQLDYPSRNIYANSIAADSSGNTYAAGYTDVGINGNSLTGSTDFFVIKYDSAGNDQWTRQLGVASHVTNASGVAVDSSGNAYVAGKTEGGLDGNTLTGFQDFFVTKYDPSGNKQWTKQLGVAGQYTFAQGISLDSSGNSYVAGGTTGGLDGNTLTGTQDLFVTKYDSTGAKLWTRQLGAASKASLAFSVAVDGSSNVYVAGFTKGSLDGQTLTGIQDYFVTKYSSGGVKLWTKQLGVASQYTEAKAISVDSSGNVYISGETGGSLDGQTYYGVTDFFFTKYDPNGQRQWTIQNGKSGAHMYNTAIAVDSASHIYVGGTTDSGIDNLALIGTQDGFFSKYSTPNPSATPSAAGAP